MKDDKIARACSMYERREYAYKDMLQKLEGK
jgi:hypothetical protein